MGKRRPDRFTPDQYNFLDKEIQPLLAWMVIRKSTSLWNNPVILREKEGLQAAHLGHIVDEDYHAAAAFKMEVRTDVRTSGPLGAYS